MWTLVTANWVIAEKQGNNSSTTHLSRLEHLVKKFCFVENCHPTSAEESCLSEMGSFKAKATNSFFVHLDSRCFYDDKWFPWMNSICRLLLFENNSQILWSEISFAIAWLSPASDAMPCRRSSRNVRISWRGLRSVVRDLPSRVSSPS